MNGAQKKLYNSYYLLSLRTLFLFFPSGNFSWQLSTFRYFRPCLGPVCVKQLCSHSHGHFQLCFCSGTWRIHGEQFHRLEVHFGQTCKPLEELGNLVCSSLSCSIINWMPPKWCNFDLGLTSEKFCAVLICGVQLRSGGFSLPSEHCNLCYPKGPIKKSLY